MDEYQEGQTATNPKTGQKVVYRGGQWHNASEAGTPTITRTKPTADDMKALIAASDKAATERDAAMDYDRLSQAVNDFSSGPVKARFLDMVLPDQDGGVLDTVGATVGLLARPFISGRTIEARDHLNTHSAQTALTGSQMMKGSSSDKDTALMRTAGVSPYKSQAENQRIIAGAEREGGLNQTRSLLKSQWIARFGSLATPSPNGMTYEQAQKIAEDDFLKRPGSKSARPRGLPKPPPRKAAPSGWAIEKVN
jgi:hypothetical protein